jgi:hypothetical protein
MVGSKVILMDRGNALVGNVVDIEMSGCGPFSVPEYRVKFLPDEDYMRQHKKTQAQMLSEFMRMGQKATKPMSLKADKVIFHPPATIVLWDDGTKTVVKCDSEDVFDEMKGLALCYMKKALGNTSRELNKALRNR